MFDNKRDREDPEIGGAGMADIAFLLLIFFLLVTTIDVDTGIGLQLPPAPEENQEPPPIKERNLLNILVNSQGMVLMDEEPTPVNQVKQKVKEFVTNRGKNPELSDSPDKAIVSIKTDRETPYNVYIDMLDEVMGAYAELRNQGAQSEFGVSYEQLEEGSEQQQAIKDMYPKKISIAEPNQ
ncbi:biopolymer transporter ExbD [Aliifodinibius salipaludis]|uniref:Biopolymer transporter ExbD n=1 Tax=Fodinibius salipaludis TaxID=2032627 RepID=A0A2A2G806_9BACT|nr:biopolymer transporter ExbD [Aliifodinibius salipaludis]PAU93124.1 biopolymer transporter ExbD [Aliifodinibius salipaludis]